MVRPLETSQPTKVQMECVHYWKIEPADGRESSLGECQICHLRKLHQNSIPYYKDHWGNP